MSYVKRRGTIIEFAFLQNIHVSFLRTVPPYSHQADVWVELLKHFNYMKIIFIHSSDTDGRALLGRFQTTSQNLEDDVEIKVHVRYDAILFLLLKCYFTRFRISLHFSKIITLSSHLVVAPNH